ncbi:MAG: NUDIX hydrolase [Sphingomonas sp.]|nr:NUDIX hydrolase [Sphingomonas sp.]
MALAHRIVARAFRAWFWLRRPRTIGVRALLVDPHGRIALVRHHYTRFWYLPGGGVHRNEDMGSAVQREVAEEVGIDDAPIVTIAGIFHNRREYKNDHVVLFVMMVGADAAARLHAADRREIAEARWFAPDALPDTVSPATQRRIAEYQRGETGLGTW